MDRASAMRRDGMHDWELLASASGSGVGGFGPVVVAVCRECGLIRAQEAGHGRDEARIDLSGECEGRRSLHEPRTPR